MYIYVMAIIIRLCIFFFIKLVLLLFEVLACQLDIIITKKN